MGKYAEKAVKIGGQPSQRTSAGRAAGKRTRVEGLARATPRALVEMAREQGGDPLPSELRARLEGVSGQDVGGVQVNVGPEAGEAAAAVNARAYTFGSQINFAAGEYNPSSEEGQELIAHEVGHALQQQSATEPAIARREANTSKPVTADLAFSSPALEAEADSFAEAFCSRISVPRLSSAPTVHVARRGTRSKSKRKKKTRRKKSNRVLLPNPVRSTSGVSFAQVAAVAAGEEDEESLGTTWVSGLNSNVRSQIERGFSLQSQDKEFSRKIQRDKQLRKMARAHDKAVKAREKQALRAAKARGEKVGNRKQKRSALADDDDFQSESAAMKSNYERDREGLIAKRRAAFDTSKVRHEVSESFIELPDKMTREEARLLAKLNFVDWSVSVLGSEAAARAHFGAIRPVAGFSGLLLHADAGAALSNANKLFMKKFPGQEFAKTTGGFSLRNRHQGRHPRGKQGHPLGIAIDFKGFENPYQTDPLKGFLVRRFGGPNADGSGGTNRMDIKGATPKAMRMAKEMKADGKLSAQSEKDLIQVRKAHNAMVETSERFKQQLASERPELRAARTGYIDVVGPGSSRIAAINRSLRRLRRAAKVSIRKKRRAEFRDARKAAIDAAMEAAKADGRKLSRRKARREIDASADIRTLKKKSRIVTDQMIEAHKSVAPLLDEKATIESDIAEQETKLKTAMKTTFKPWVDELAEEIAAKGAALPTAIVDSPPSRGRISAARRSLRRIAAVVAAFKKACIKPGKRAGRARNRLVARLEKVLAKFADVFGTHALADDTDLIALYEQLKKIPGPLREIKSRKEIIDKLQSDITFVFGGKSGAYRKTVVDPSIMQLLEAGFIRNDPVGAAAPRTEDRGKDETKKSAPKGRSQTFNAEFTAIMMQFGFTPGGAWSSSVDTMHYDYRPGYAKLTGGGMTSVRYGPKGAGGKKKKKKKT